MHRCEGCGFEYDLDGADEAAAAIAAGASELAALLAHADDPARRQDPDVWSPLEYACHVRDVLLVQRERVLRARREDVPLFEPMGRDERVAHDGYAHQRVEDVARQLGDAALMLGNVLSLLDEVGWERPVAYNYPVPAERSLRWVAVHTVHEVQHHLGDVRRQVQDPEDSGR